MKYIIYKITNKLNCNIYIGSHITKNINDSYMGSGTNIRNAIKQIGKHNFVKEILYTYDNEIDMLNKEAELVNAEFIKRQDTYNIILGGGFFCSKDCINVKNRDGETLMVHKTDPRYLSGELVGVTKGNTTVKDNNGNTSYISVSDERYLTGNLMPVTKDCVVVKDNNGNILQVHKTDPRYLSGEFVGVTKGKKHKQETKIKMSQKAALRVGDKNSMYGKTHSDESKKQTSDKLKGVGAVNFYVYDTAGKFITEAICIKEYAEQTGINRTSIIAVLKGQYKTAGGRKFFYEYMGDKLQ